MEIYLILFYIIGLNFLSRSRVNLQLKHDLSKLLKGVEFAVKNRKDFLNLGHDLHLHLVQVVLLYDLLQGKAAYRNF